MPAAKRFLGPGTGACILLLLQSAAGTSGAAAAQAADTAHWVTTWSAAPMGISQSAGPLPASPSFSNQTVRQTVRVSLGGRRIRIRLSNEQGERPLRIGAASIALASGQGEVQAGTRHAVTFSGQRAAVAPAGTPLVSDPIDLPVAALGTLSISLYLPDETGACPCHRTGMQTAYVSGAGNFADSGFSPQSTTQYRVFLSGVDVETDTDAGAVVVLADSIADGVGSTLDANRRWPDLLADRLDAGIGGKARWGVANMGIFGNRLLADGSGASALARFDRDVLAMPGVRALIVSIGINDLGMAYDPRPKAAPAPRHGALADIRAWLRARLSQGRQWLVHLLRGTPGQAPAAHAQPAAALTAQDMIAAYRQLIARAHAHGIPVYGATITPYKGATYYSAQGESLRQAVNAWIRTGHEFDAVIDFDAAWRDPGQPAQVRGDLTIDHLHGNDAGYRALADSIDPGLLR